MPTVPCHRDDAAGGLEAMCHKWQNNRAVVQRDFLGGRSCDQHNAEFNRQSQSETRVESEMAYYHTTHTTFQADFH